MDFSMLNQIFQDNLSIILTVIVVLLVLLIILSIVMLVKLSKAKKRYNSLVNGATGESLEDIIADNIAQMNNKIDADYAEMKSLFTKSIQKVAVHRFCAFADMGGDLSYAVALLDNQNNGVIFSSIFGRQDSCTYVKPIENGVSKYPLTQEENKVLLEAMSK